MKRRTIGLADLDEVLDECRRLEKSGYERVGNWSLGQVTNHLAIAFEIAINGPIARFPVFLQRAFVGTFLRLRFLGRIGNFFRLRLPTIAPQNMQVDDQVGLERLMTAIQAFSAARAAHLTAFELWHCEHHLSFLIPRTDPK